MTATISAAGLGLYGATVAGNASLHPNGTGDQVHINTTNGNLVVRIQDEFLVSQGLDSPLLRTYNAQGALDGDNNDGWRIGVYRRLHSLTGTVNTASSTITKVYGDGAEALFTYDTTRGLYVSTRGEDAHDTLSFSTSGGSTWSYNDGNSLGGEVFSNNGQLLRLIDSDGNATTFTYTGSLVTQISDASGQTTHLDYSGNLLTQIRVVSQGQTQTRTHYAYDTSSRLQHVRVDLSPEDNSITDGKVYTTTYSYEGTSTRIASISQSDGTSISFTYELIAGEYRVKTYTDGEGRTTTLTYSGITSASAPTVNANPAVLATTDTQTVTESYSLNAGATTTPVAGWSGAALLESSATAANDAKIAFDANGNGFAIWRQGGDLLVRRYTAATNTWSAQTTLDTRTNTVYAPSLSVDPTGNAVAAWVQSNGTANSTYVSTYNAASGIWSAAQLIETLTLAVSSGSGTVVTSISNNRIAAGWLQTDGTRNNFHVARYDGNSWSAAESVEASTNAAALPTLAIDAQGNVIALWQQSDGTANSLYVNRFAAASGTWSGPTLFESSTTAAGDVKLAFDATGNGFAIWRQGNDLWMRRYTAANNTWAPQVALDTRNNPAYAPALAVDASGNAIAAWVQSNGTANSTYVSRFSATTGTWSTAALLESATQTVATTSNSVVLATAGNISAAGWLQTDGTRNNLYVARYANGAWSAPELIETNDNVAAQPSLALDEDGNVTVLWQQSDGTANSIYQQRFANVAGTPYYSVPSGASWASVALALYGTAAGADALQSALGNPALTTGTQLTGMPASLDVTTATSITVPAYYTVQAGNTWASITQAIYGTNDAAVVAALQTALGNPSLSPGLRLTVPQTLSYGVGTPSIANRVDIRSHLGLVSTLFNDASGRLERVLSPAVAGVQTETRYAYDAAGNPVSIIEDVGGKNRTTTFEYDARGNLTLSRDAAGNTVSRSYSAANQVLTETRYTTADPDGAGTAQPSGALTTRYAYDTEGHLRFVVAADGGITEHQYNLAGNLVTSLRYTVARYNVSALAATTTLSETQLATWATSQDRSKLERTEYAYDFRGNLERTTTFSATDSSGEGIATSASISRFVYDQRGRLIKNIDARGEATADLNDYVTTFAYDGLGRLFNTTSWLANGVSRTTLTQHDDASRRTVTTHANGLISTSLYNRAGEMISLVNSGPAAQDLGTTTFKYDGDGRLRFVTDPTGQRVHKLYDDAGRTVAEIDADGTLTEHVYSRTSQLVKTIQYADRLSAASIASLVDASGNPTSVSLTSLRDSLASVPGRNPAQDMITRMVYDSAGRVAYQIDDAGAVTQVFHDGAGRVTSTVAYAVLVSIDRSVDELLPADLSITTSTDDRRTRNFHDSVGRLTATLDAEGYLVEYTYDAAGRLIQQTGHANVTSTTYRLTGTLAQLRPAADNETVTDPERDIVSHYFYDGMGRQVGTLNAEGHFTETVYDARSNVFRSIRHGGTFAVDTFANLQLQAASGNSQTTTYQYDGANRLTRETSFDGTITTFTYNHADQLISTTRALGTSEVRTVQSRYDALGRVTAELSGEGSALLTGGMTQTQIDAIWAQYAVQHTYDQAGRRTSSTDQLGNKTLYFYDADGRRTHSVNAEGEVTEMRYDAHGRVTDTISYANDISTAGLTGGLVSTTLTGRITPDAVKDAHSRVTYAYGSFGQEIGTTTAEGSLRTEQLNAFGQVFNSLEQIDASTQRQQSYTYDKIGQLKITRWDPTGINRSETRVYDAFGRVARITDQNNNIYRSEYDRLGRVIATVDPLNRRRTTTYDAYNRVLTTRDAFQGTQNTTTYVYDDVQRKVVVTTPEGISVSTILNRHGQTLSFTDGVANTTTYTYDVNGQLDTVSDNLSTNDGRPLEDRLYDRAGRLETSTDARGSVTRFAYDAANRMLTRTVDSGTGGVALQTRYVYDELGRVTDVTDPNGVLTRTEYDRDGRVTAVTVDPDGTERSRTAYTYDKTGSVLTVTEGDGSTTPRTTQYIYDKLGRRTDEIVDPGTGRLNLRTRYRYDANGNLTRRLDPKNSSTWYVYDVAGQLRFTVNTQGGVTETLYDLEGRAVSERQYATPIVVSAFGNVVTMAQISVAQSSADRLDQSIYDLDGREVYTVDASGGVTRKEYDDNNNLTRSIRYAVAIPVQSYPSVAAIEAALIAAEITPATPQADDRVEETVYDMRSRVAYRVAYDSVDGDAAVIAYRHDAAGNVVSSTAYATLWDRTQPLGTWATARANDAGNRTTRTWYDGANRPAFTLDAEGYLTETRYDEVNRRTSEIVYVTPASGLSASSTLQNVRANAIVQNLNPVLDQVTILQYDSAGRLESTTDAAGLTERYGYDESGNRTSFTDKKGAIWTYEYDAANRMSFERSPAVNVTTIAESGSSLTSATASASIVTYIQYDALGNVWKRTEAHGTTQARTTEYQYDTLGRQTRTILPPVSVYNAPTGDELRAGSAVVRSETSVTPTTEVAYDSLGYAFRFKDVAGNYSFKAYDQVRRMSFEVDALGYVTRTTYDVFGNELSLVRFANPLSAALPSNTTSVSASQIEALLTPDNANDRLISHGYDRLGRVTRITRPAASNFSPNANSAGGTTFTAGANTHIEYNAFGQIVFQRERINEIAGVFADTYFYYDRRGLQTAKVDPLGYLTTFQFDETGDLKRQTEYARPLTAGTWNRTSYGTPVTTTRAGQPNNAAGYDRVTVLGYDRLNRLTSQTLIDVEYTTISNGDTTNQFGDQLTTRGYDALGNLTRITDASGASTYTYYDQLGRVVAIAQPQRDVDGSATTQLLTPLSIIRRNAYGDMVEELSYANGASGASEAAYVIGTASTADRSTKLLVNRYGKVTRTEDGAGIDRYASYTVSGQVAKEWQYVTNGDGIVETLVTIRRYDALGQEIAIIEPQRLAVAANLTLGTVTSTPLNSSWESDGYYYYSWSGNNTVNVSYPSIGNVPVQVQIEYETHPDGPIEVRTVSQNFSSIATGVTFTWSEWTTPTPDTPQAGGIGQVLRVRILGKDSAGNYSVILRSLENGPAVTPTIVTKEARYNAFGDVDRRGTNGGWQEYFDYDRAGRVWRTNAGDGVDKVFLYDLAGNATVEIRSQQRDLRTYGNSADSIAQTLPAHEQMRTETVYDLLGRIVQRRLPTFTPSSDLDTIGATIGIGMLQGPRNPNAVYQKVDYYDDYTGAYNYSDYVINPLATEDEGGGYYLSNGTYILDSTHTLITVPRISWEAPATAGVVARFVYRQNGTGSWVELPVGLQGDNKLGVDVSALVNSQGRLYEYRLTYSRAPENVVFAEATGTFRVDGTTNTTIGISQTPPDPAAEIATLATTQGNATLSWTAPSDASITATLYLKPTSTGTWTTYAATRQSGSFRVTPAMLTTAGIYDYEIVHTRAGNVVAKKVGQLTSTGTTTVRTVTNQGLTQDPVSAVNLLVASVSGNGGGATVARIVSSGEQYSDSGDTYYFVGENRVDLSWASLGTSRVRVVLDYRPHDTSVLQDAMTRTFMLPAGSTSGSLAWYDEHANWGGIGQVTRVRLYTETTTNANDWSLRLDQSNPADDANRNLNWDMPPGNLGIVASFEIKAQGSSSYSSLAIQTGQTGRWKVDLSSQAAGNHDYRIRYRIGNRVVSEQTGVIGITNGSTSVTTTATVTPGTPVPNPESVAQLNGASQTTTAVVSVGTPPPAGESVSAVTGSSATTTAVVVPGSQPPAAEGVATVNPVSAATTAIVVPGTAPTAPEGVATVNAVSGAPAATTSIGSSSSFHISYEWAGDFWSWNGTNTINVNYQNIGSVPIRLRIEYRTAADGDGVAPVETRDFTTGVLTNKPTGASYSWFESNGGNAYEIPVAAGGVGQVLRVRVMGQDGSGNYTVVLRDTAAPSGGVGLTWATPSNPAFTTTRFFYRQGAGAWIERTVTRSGSSLNVDLGGLAAGQYSYLIGHQRSGEAFYASTATGLFTTNGSTVTRDSQTNGTELPAWIAVSHSGNAVTWAQAPEAGAAVSFEYWNGSSWVARAVSTPNNLNYSVNMAGLAGNYQYRVRYTRAGAPTPYREATGNVTVATSGGASSSIGSSASFSISYEWAGDFWSWNGTNTVNVSYQNIGNIPVRLRIEYRTADGDGVAPVETRDFTTGVLTNKPTGASYSWTESNSGNAYEIPVAAGGIGQVLRVRVMGQDASGNYTVVIRDTSAPAGGVGMTWAVPSDPAFTTTRLFYRQGTGAWIERAVTRSGSSLNVDLAGLPSGQYSYLIGHQRSGEAFYASTATGLFTTNGTSVTRDSQTNGSELPAWLSVSHSANTVAWAQAPEAGASVSFEYWNGSSWVARAVSTTNNVNYNVNMVGLAGNYQYRVRYTRSGAATPYREALGNVTVTTSGGASTSATGSAAFSYSYEYNGDIWSWNGTNSINVSYQNIGNIPVRLRIAYETDDGDGMAPVETREFTTEVLSNRATGTSYAWSEYNSGTGTAVQAGGLGRVLRVRVLAQDASGNYTVVVRDTAAPAGGAGLNWSVPSDPAITATRFFYRQGTGAWIERTVTRSGASLSVDLAGLAAGQYSYLIGHQRSGEAFYASTATGLFTTTGTTVTRDSQTNGSELPAWINVSQSGNAVTWAQSPEAGATVSFEYWNGSNWVARSVGTSDNLNYSANMTGLSGSFHYRVRYTRSGAATPYREAIGTVKVTASGGASASATGSAAFNISYEYNGDVWGWNGTNSVNVSYQNIGNIPVRLRIEYETAADDDGVAPVETRDITTAVLINKPTGATYSWSESFGGNTNQQAVQAGGIGRVLRVRVLTQDAAGNYTVVVRDTATPASGVGLTWATPSDPAFTTTRFFYRQGTGAWIERSVTRSGASLNVDLAGVASGQYEYLVGHQRSGESFYASTATGLFTTNGSTVTRNGQSNGTELPAWLTVSHSGNAVTWTQAPEAGATVSFEYWTGSSWVARSVTTANNLNYSVNMTGLAGNFQYRVHYFRSGASNPYRIATGTVAVSAVQSGSQPSVSVTPQTNTKSPTVQISTVSISGDRLSWNYAAEAGTTVKIRYYFDNQSQTVYERTAEGSSPNFSVTFPELPAGAHVINYSVLYLRSGETDPYARANGRANVTLSNPTQQAVTTINAQTAVFPSGVQQIAAPTDAGNNLVNWTTAAEAGATVRFEYWASGGQRITLPVVPNGQGFRVDISQLTAGAYNYDIVYTRANQSTPYARGIGTFTVARADAYTAFSHNDTTATTQAPAALRPVQRQTLDRWGNAIAVTNAAQATTNYRFNQFNQLVETQLATVNIVDTQTTVSESSARPTTRNYYDINGRVIATRDANGNLAHLSLNAAGQTLVEARPDGGRTNVRYDAFGNQVEVTDALGYRTRNVYDKANRLIAVASEINKSSDGVLRGFSNADPANLNSYAAADVVINRYTYDEAGRRIAETNGENEIIRYYYDLHGNLTRRFSAMWHVNEYEYDAFGNKTRELDANRNQMTWSFDASKQYDYFHRVSGHADLGGTNTAYTYNEAGALRTQISTAGQNTTYSYDTAGQLSRIVDAANAAQATAAGLEVTDRITVYGYDSAGRRNREKTYIGTDPTSSSDDRSHQDLRITYDALGRVSNLIDLRYIVNYSYDAQGNRTRIKSTYFDHQQTQRTQDLWYQYDTLNRVVISQGVNTDSTISIDANQGIRLGYDTKGQRTIMETYGSDRIVYEHIETEEYDGSWSSNPHYKNESGLYDESYDYDGLGRLKTVERSGIKRESYAGQDVTETEHNWVVAQHSYDKASRQINDQTLSVENYALVARSRETAFDADGRMLSQTTRRSGYAGQMLRESVLTYQYDAASVLRSYSVSGYNFSSASNPWRYTSVYTNGYRLAETYQETTQTVVSSGSGAPLPGLTKRRYNANNELTAFLDTKDPKKDRYFANGSTGQPLTVIQGYYASAQLVANGFENALLRRDNAVKAQHFFFANGQNVGSFGQLQTAGVFKANFDINYTPISNNYPASTPSQVVVQAGDTLRAVAARVFGDASLWYVLAEENGLTDPDAALVEGSLLRVPNTVVARSNNATSFKPFSIGDAIGDTTPTQPAPPPPSQKGCGIIAQIILIIIVIVVTIYTAGAGSIQAGAVSTTAATGTAAGTAAAGTTVVATSAAATAAGATTLTLTAATAGQVMAAGMLAMGGSLGAVGIAAAAVGGAVGSIVGQGIGIATGMQDKFSWKAVGMSALGSAISAGAGSVLDKVLGPASTAKDFSWGNVGRAAAQGALGNAGTQLTQGKFSWRDVAASAVSSAAGNALGQAFDGSKFNKYARDAFIGFASGAASQAVANGKVDARGLFANTASSVGAGYIGDHTGKANSLFGEEGSWRHVAAHALLAYGSAKISRTDATGAAIGAAAAAVSARFVTAAFLTGKSSIGPQNRWDLHQKFAPEIGRLIGASAAQALGRDPSVGAAAAHNMVVNNDLAHMQRWASKMVMDAFGIKSNEDLAARIKDILATAEKTLDGGKITIAGVDINLGGAAGNNVAITLGVAAGLLGKGVEALKGLAALADIPNLARDSALYTLATAIGFDSGADLLRGRHEEFQGLISATEAFANQLLAAPMDTVKDMLFGSAEAAYDAFKTSLSSFNSASNGGQNAALMEGFQFGKASGEFAVEALSLAATVIGGVGLAAKGVKLSAQLAGQLRSGDLFKGLKKKAEDANTRPAFGSLTPPVRLARPSWRQSELDLEGLYGPHGYNAQASFLRGQPVPHGTAGSTRPDVYIGGESIDIKNYNVQSAQGQRNLVRNVVSQAQSRAHNLPAGDVQKIVIDARGQNVSTSALRSMAAQIERQSNGLITQQNVTVWR